MSERFWRSRLGSNPDVIGMVLHVPQPATIVGVLPDAPILPLVFTHQPDLIFPISTHPGWYGRSTYGFEALVRLRPGVSIGQARSELEVRARQLRTTYPQDNEDFDPKILSIRNAILGKSERLLWLLFSATGVIWLIALANFGALLAVRLEERQAEFAIRHALGATARHLVVEICREVAVVIALGSGAGAFAAWAAISFIKTHATWFDLPRLAEVQFSTSGLLFGVASAIGVGLVGVLINLHSVIWRSSGGLLQGGWAQRYSQSARLSRIIVTAQFCLALILTNMANVAGRSLVQTENRVLGYNERDVLAMEVRLPPRAIANSDAEERWERTTFKSMIDFAGKLPDVRMATGAYPRPTTKEFLTDFFFIEDGAPSGDLSRLSRPVLAVRRDVATNYFQSMATPLLRGRPFFPLEDSAPGVVLVNAAFVRAYSPTREPIGRWLFWKYTGPTKRRRIVGVVGDSIESPLDNLAQPTVYTVEFRNLMDLLVQTDRPQAVIGPIRKFVRNLDGSIIIRRIGMLDDAIQAPLGRLKTQVSLSAVFALVSILLAAAGLYGVVRHEGECRRRDYAIRLALGSTKNQLIGMRLLQTLRTTGLGLGCGIFLSVASSKIVQSQLFHVSAIDPLMLAFASSILLIVVVVASYASIRATTDIELSELLHSI